MLVTTSCGSSDRAIVERDEEEGLWVRLSAESWPRETSSIDEEVVRQISAVFPTFDSPSIRDEGRRQSKRVHAGTISDQISTQVRDIEPRSRDARPERVASEEDLEQGKACSPPKAPFIRYFVGSLATKLRSKR